MTEEFSLNFRLHCAEEYEFLSTKGRTVSETRFEKSFNFIPNHFNSIFQDFQYISKNLLTPYQIMHEVSYLVSKNKYEKTWAYGPAFFLDAGCGICNVVQLARNFSYSASGIDLDEKLLEEGGKLIKNSLKSQLIHGNILEYNNYKFFDIIYFYRPFIRDEHQIKFEEKIIKESQKSVIFMAYERAYKGPFDNLKHIEGTHGVYVKK